MFILYSTLGALPATWGGKTGPFALFQVGKVDVYPPQFWEAQ